VTVLKGSAASGQLKFPLSGVAHLD
jgi:hypothetical protein